MSQSIIVDELELTFRVPQKRPGFTGAVRGFFAPQYNTVTAVDKISFSVGPGELVGFIGPNGAGKTSTLKMLAGLLAPTSGKVSVHGNIPFQRKEAHLKQIALVMGQKNQLIWDLPASDTFLLNKAIYEIPHERFQHVLNELVDLLDVSEQMNTPVRKLSLGQRMKMELIAALLHTPKVLFLDEPTIGLDVMVQRNLRDFVREYNRKYEATILLTSHYMGDVQELCSRVIIISHGSILFDGKLDTLIKEHSPHKLLKVTFPAAVPKAEIQQLGKIHEWEPLKTSLFVPRDLATKRAALLLEKYHASDLTIEETPIEDIIRDIFHNV